MATPNPLQLTDTDLAIGESTDVSVTFQTSPGTPDVPEVVELMFDGAVFGNVTANLMRRGVPAELTPTVTVGAVSGWGIRLQSGRPLTALGGNRFRVTN
jgi:hypothetical protein